MKCDILKVSVPYRNGLFKNRRAGFSTYSIELRHFALHGSFSSREY